MSFYRKNTWSIKEDTTEKEAEIGKCKRIRDEIIVKKYRLYGIHKKAGTLLFLVSFFGVLFFAAYQEVNGESQETSDYGSISDSNLPSSSSSTEDCMEIFDYLSEDEEIKETLEEIIKKRDEAFLAELEQQALLAKIKQDNENAMTSVSEDMEEFKQKEGEKLLEQEDKENGDVPQQTFQEKMEAKRQEEQSRADQKKVVSIQDVFSPNTDKTVNDYEHTLVFKITAYCPCAQCNGPWSGGATSTGARATQGRTIAVDPRVIPYGTKVLIGGHEFVAEDCGGAIKGAHIDLYLDSHDRCNSWGVRYLSVSWNGGSNKMIETLKRQQ